MKTTTTPELAEYFKHLFETIDDAIGRDYVKVSRALVRALGDGNAGLLLGYFMDIIRFKSTIIKKNGGWFYCKVEKAERELGFSRWTQRSAIEKIISMGLMTETRMGLPARRFFKLDSVAIASAMAAHKLEYKSDEEDDDDQD